MDDNISIHSDDSEALLRGENENSDTNKNATATHTLLLIDCHKDMFQRNLPLFATDEINDHKSNVCSPIEACILTAEQMLRVQIQRTGTGKSMKRDSIGVFFYNCCADDDDGGGDSSSNEDNEYDYLEETQETQTQTKVISRRYGEHSQDDDSSSSSSSSSSESDSDDDEGNKSNNNKEDNVPRLGDISNSLKRKAVHEFIPLQPPARDVILDLRSYLPECLQHWGNEYVEVSTSNQGNKKEPEQETSFVVETDNNKLLSYKSSSTQTDALQRALSDVLYTSNPKKSPLYVRKNDSFRCIILTCRNHPCLEDDEESSLDTKDARNYEQEEVDRTKQYCKDMCEAGWDLSLWPIVLPEQPFDFNVLYKRIFDFLGGQGEFLEHRSVEDLVSRVYVMNRYSMKSFTAPLVFTNGLRYEGWDGIMLNFHRTVAIKRRPYTVTINSETKRFTNKVFENRAQLDDSKVEPPQIHSFLEFSDSRAYISKEDEIVEIKRASRYFTEKSKYGYLMLAGFKPLDMEKIPLHYLSVEVPYFAIPNDDVTEGSIAAFSSLFAAMVRKRVYGVAELVPKHNSPARLVWIFPHSSGGVESFVIFMLPFEDDLRVLSKSDMARLPNEQVLMKMKSIVTNGRLKGVKEYPNPALTRFWSSLEAFGLNLPDYESSKISKIDQDIEATNAKIYELAGEMVALLGPDIDPTKKEKKRKAPSSAYRGDVDINFMLSLYSTGEITSCTVDQLKSFLRNIGQKTTGKKKELVERVEIYFSSEYNENIQEEKKVKLLIPKVEQATNVISEHPVETQRIKQEKNEEVINAARAATVKIEPKKERHDYESDESTVAPDGVDL